MSLLQLASLTSVIGSASSGYSQIAQGQAQQEAYEYNADIALRESAIKEKQARERYSILIGQQRALYAEAGVDVNSGSPLVVTALQAAEAEEEAQAIRFGGRSKADVLRYTGRQAKRAGVVSGLSTFVTGLASTATQYATLKGVSDKGTIAFRDLSPVRSDW